MSKLEFALSSDREYENMVVNLDDDDSTFAILNYENGIENAEVRILDPRENKVLWTLNYADFTRVLQKGFVLLNELARQDVERALEEENGADPS